MQERIEVRIEREVPVWRAVQVEVAEENRCRGTRAGRDGLNPHWRGEDGKETSAHEQRPERGDQTADPTEVEATEPQPAGAVELTGEQVRDHESRDHKEDVDADEPAGEAEVGVEEHHEHHCQGAKALDVGALIRRGRGSGIGRGSRHEGRNLYAGDMTGHRSTLRSSPNDSHSSLNRANRRHVG